MKYRKSVPWDELTLIGSLGLLFFATAGFSTHIWRLGVEMTVKGLPVVLLTMLLGCFLQRLSKPMRITLLLLPALCLALPYAIRENGFGGRETKWMHYIFDGGKPKNMEQFAFEERGGYLEWYFPEFYRIDYEFKFRCQADESDWLEAVKESGLSSVLSKGREIHNWKKFPNGDFVYVVYDKEIGRGSGHLQLNPKFRNVAKSRRNAQNLASIFASAQAAGHDFSKDAQGDLLWTIQNICNGYTIPESDEGPFAGTYFGVPLSPREQHLALPYLNMTSNGMLIYDDILSPLSSF